MRELIVSKAVASTPSHGLRGVPRPELVRAAIPQRLMGTALVVPVHPVPDGASCVLQRVKLMLPRIFLFEAPKEPLNDVEAIEGGKVVSASVEGLRRGLREMLSRLRGSR